MARKRRRHLKKLMKAESGGESESQLAALCVETLRFFWMDSCSFCLRQHTVVYWLVTWRRGLLFV